MVRPDGGSHDEVDAKVTLKVKDAKLGDLLDLICRITETKIEKSGDGVVFKRR